MSLSSKEKRAKAKKVFDLLMASPELGTYTRPFVRSWRQTHCPKAEWDHLIETRTPEQIAKYLLHFCRTNRKSWAGQLKFCNSAMEIKLVVETNELRTDGDTFIVARDPTSEGKILILERKNKEG